MTSAEAWDGDSKETVSDTNGSDFIEIGEYLSASTLDNVIFFQGRRYDAESGLYYFRNRQYDPQHGCFLSRDPVGYKDSHNLYQFVNNNPIVYTDPMGLKLVIDDCSGVENHFRANGFSGWTSTGDGPYEYSGTMQLPRHSNYDEILFRIVRSKTRFEFSSLDNLEFHIKTRANILMYIDMTKDKIKFIADRPVLRPGLRDEYEVAKDIMYTHDFQYKMACGPAANFMQYGGIGFTLGKEKYLSHPIEVRGGIPNSALNAYNSNNSFGTSSKDLSHYRWERHTNDKSDWIPGDWGYIENAGDDKSGAREGENIIYIGGTLATGDEFLDQGKFYGNIGGNKIRTWNEWFTMVNSWQGKAQPLDTRRGPTMGLKNSVIPSK